jgi:hypothetical protein
MIGSVNTTGKYVNTTSTPGYTHITINANLRGAGDVRYHYSGYLEVYDGYGWHRASGSVVGIGLNPEAESLLDWAKKKRDEELALERLAETSVTIAGLLHAKKDLEDKIKMVQILLKEEVQLGTS